MKRDDAKRMYRRLHRDAQSIVGTDFSVPLIVGNPKWFPESRNMAFCAYRDHNAGKRDIEIVVAPKLLRSKPERVEAIFRHELAHAAEFHLGEHELRKMAALDGETLPPGPERRADKVAEIIWGEPIYYDEILVQTLSGGKRPRPRHLGL
jgi:hypothetical protein